MEVISRHILAVSCFLLPFSNIQAFPLEEKTMKENIQDHRILMEINKIVYTMGFLSELDDPTLLIDAIIESKAYFESEFHREISWDQIFHGMEKYFVKYDLDLSLLDSLKESIKKRCILKHSKHLGDMYDDFCDLPANTRAGLAEAAVGSAIIIIGGGNTASEVIGGGLILDGARRIADDYAEYGN